MISHTEYVAMGYCAATIDLNPKKGKRGRVPEPRIAWCLRRAHTTGDHVTLSLAPKIAAEYVYWSGASETAARHTTQPIAVTRSRSQHLKEITV